jgi:hypothetical protein
MEMNKIVVNGREYESIKNEKADKLKMSSMAYASLMAAASLSSSLYGGGFGRKLRDGINIVQEFELIQQKKSKLSKWERDEVVRQFNNAYKPIEQ